jgi:dihydrodipicolinate synthase/N-acetylneuraminate lyase
MNRRGMAWGGPMSAVITPFDDKGSIDEAMFARVVQQQLADGVTGFVVGGCTGEFWSLSTAERKRLHALCVEVVGRRVPVIAGTSAITTADTIELTAHAKEAGCDGAMVMPPWFVKLPARDIVEHFAAVSRAVDLPLMAYNIPSTNINPLTPAIADRLADIPNVVALKESSFDYDNFYATINLVKDRVLVFGPTRGFGCAALQLGAVGSVGVLHHIWGRNLTEWHNAVVRGDLETGMRMQRFSESIGRVITGNGRNLYAGIKGGMQVLGWKVGWPRSPLLPLTAGEMKEIEAGFRELGLLADAAVASRSEKATA